MRNSFNFWLLFSFFLICIPVLIVCYYTPIHSDDFYYISIGFNLAAQLEHYLGWSGRFVANLISGSLLSIDNRFFLALVNSMATALLVINVALFPFLFIAKNGLRLFLSAILIFLCYWVSNPNLGQVAFWIVGTANYGWTSVFVVYFLRKYAGLSIRDNVLISKSELLLIILSGFMAGCSNENVGVSLLLSLIILFFANACIKKTINWKLASYLLPCFLGVLVLLCSPGNYIRKAAEGAGWDSKSIFQKLWEHFFFRVPESMSHLWMLFVLIVILLVLINRRSTIKYSIVSLVVLIIFIFELVVMVAAPSFPARAVNAPFVMLLCILSLSLSRLDGLNRKIFYGVSIFTLLFYFIPNYLNTVLAYKSLYAQSEIRKGIILNGKEKGNKDIAIPNYFFKELVSGNYFDLFHSDKSMSDFFGVKSISVFDAGFDYSAVNKDCINKLKSEVDVCLTSYFDNLFATKTYILQLNAKGSFINENVFYLKIKSDDKEMIFPFNSKPVLIGDGYFIYKRLQRSEIQNGTVVDVFMNESDKEIKMKIVNSDY